MEFLGYLFGEWALSLFWEGVVAAFAPPSRDARSNVGAIVCAVLFFAALTIGGISLSAWLREPGWAIAAILLDAFALIAALFLRRGER